VLCRLEIRQVEKTKVDEEAQNVFYIVQGNDATPDEPLRETGSGYYFAQNALALLRKMYFCVRAA